MLFQFAKIQLISDIATNPYQKSVFPCVAEGAGLCHSDEEQALRCGGDAAMVSRAAADNPEYAVVGIDKEQLVLFVEQAVFMVGEEVADELGALRHAQRLETVGGMPVAKGERQCDGVGVEKHLVGREAARVRVRLRGGETLDMNAGQLVGRRCLEGCYEEHISVEQGRVGG